MPQRPLSKSYNNSDVTNVQLNQSVSLEYLLQMNLNDSMNEHFVNNSLINIERKIMDSFASDLKNLIKERVKIDFDYRKGRLENLDKLL